MHGPLNVKFDFLSYVMPQGNRATHEGEDVAELTHHVYEGMATHTSNLGTK
jgi:hypothetical protein